MKFFSANVSFVGYVRGMIFRGMLSMNVSLLFFILKRIHILAEVEQLQLHFRVKSFSREFQGFSILLVLTNNLIIR